MSTKLNLRRAFATLASALNIREWGRGTFADGASCAGNTKPNHVGTTPPEQSPLVRPPTASPVLARSAPRTRASKRHDLILSRRERWVKHLWWAAQGSQDVGASAAGCLQPAVYVKNLPSANPRSRSDDSRGLAEGPADHAQSPPTGNTERSGRLRSGPDEGPAAHPQSPSATTTKRPSRRAPLRRRHIRGQLAAATIAIVATAFAINAAPALALTATTNLATRSGETATLTGAVNPEKPEKVALTECFFEWGKTESYGEVAPCENPDAVQIGTNEGHVHAEITGLTEGVRYHYRLVAANGVPETVHGFDRTFPTSAAHVLSTPITGQGSNALISPDYVAVDESTGDVYVSEGSHSEQQTITVNAEGGTFTTAFKGQATAALPYDADAGEVSSALQGLSTIGPGNVAVSAAHVLAVHATGGTYTLTFEGQTTGATATGSLTEGSATIENVSASIGTLVAGEAVSAAKIPAGTVIENFNEGTHELTLSAPVQAGGTAAGVELTAALPYDASPATLKGALQALPSIGSGNVAVTETAAGVYEIAFAGPLAHGPEPLLRVDATDLTGGSAESANEITLNFGPADEGPLFGVDLPQLTADGAALTGAVHTATTATTATGGGARVEKFNPAGEFLLMLGGDVNKTKVEAAEHGTPIAAAEEDLCTATQEEEGDTCQPATPGSSPGAFQATPGAASGVGDETSALFLAVDNSSGESKGDLYVGDHGDSLVSKFTPEGQLIATWGADGQLDGFTARDGPFSTDRGLEGVAVNPADGDLLVSAFFRVDFEFEPDGSWLATAEPISPAQVDPYGIAVDAADNVYMKSEGREGTPGPIEIAHLRLAPGSFVLYHPHEPLGGETTKGIAIDALTRDLYSVDSDRIERFSPSCPEASCAVEAFGEGDLSAPTGIAVNAATGAVYVADTGHHRLAVFTPVPYLPHALPTPPKPKTSTEELLQGKVDPAGAGPIAACRLQYAPANDVQTLTLTGATGGTFTLRGGGNGLHNLTPPIPYDVTAQRLQHDLEGEANFGAGNVEVTGPPGGPYRIESIGFFADLKVPQLEVQAEELTPHAAAAHVTTNNVPGSWAAAATAPCEPATPYAGEEAISASAPGLQPGTDYAFRLLAENAAGTETSFAQYFTTLPQAPTVTATSATEVYADAAQVHAQIDPGGGELAYHTSYHIEYLTSEQLERNLEEGEPEFAHSESSPSLPAGSAKTSQDLTAQLSHLTPDTTYHYRVAATNECEPEKQCVVPGEARTLTTLPPGLPKDDLCPNAHVRQQTSAAQLLDCRAYELVSAPHTAGYDVESNLTEGQQPYSGYPEAKTSSGEPRVLYGIHDGGIPGAGEPTNRGVDPYLATRTPSGWTTEYVGLPASLDPASSPFSSTLLAADSDLQTLAFAGPEICAPCFSTGIETGIPLHLAGTEKPVQGMVPASGETPPSSASTDGYIAEPLSADGQHLIFGSTSRFAPGGNDNDGNVSIYDRDLATGETHAISDNENGEPLPCLPTPGQCHSPGDPNGISELAVSSDGSHVLLGQKVTEDANGNVYWHLYMDVNDSPDTIELTPGASKGVLFDGITADGEKVFLSSEEHLTHEDTSHTGTDLFLWSQSGEAEGTPLTLISTGEAGAGDTGACNPVESKSAKLLHWNSLESSPNCAVLAIGGGGGVASQSGSVYFLSPEKLESARGAKNRPNLYLAAPGSAPRFIATLSPEDPLVTDALAAAEVRHTADFQLTPSGEYAAFASTLALAGHGEQTEGYAVLYRYDAATEALACVSCTFNETPSTAASSLASDGLSLTDEGRVFFNSDDALAATDTDQRQDVYEWEPEGVGNCQQSSPSYSRVTETCLALISAGTSSSASGLLSTDADGTDAYFFTRDKLAEQDEDGPTVKVYDAREGGGFPFVPEREPCKASDECHGPASKAPPQLENGSQASTPGIGNAPEESKKKPCKTGFVRKHGKCVKKPKPHKHHRSKKRYGKRSAHNNRRAGK